MKNEPQEAAGGGGRGAPRAPPSSHLVVGLLAVLLALLLALPSATAGAVPAIASVAPSSPPLINAHLLLAVRLVLQPPHPSPAAQPLHLSLRLSCASPAARLTQNRDVELVPPSRSPSASASPSLHRGLGPALGLWSAETTFAVEMARAARQCRLSAFDKESGVRLGSKAFTLPGTGSDNAPDALVHVDLPLRLDRRQRGRPIDVLRTLSFLLRGARFVIHAVCTTATLRLRQLWRGASEVGVRAAAAAPAKAVALASAAAALFPAVLATGTAAGGVDGALRMLTAVGVLLLFVLMLPVILRLLLAAGGVDATGGRSREAATPAPGIERTTDGQEPPPPQVSVQRSRQTFVATDWHCVAHDRMGGAARIDERALANLTHAVGAGGRGAVEATIGAVVGRLLNNSVRGVLLSYKGQ